MAGFNENTEELPFVSICTPTFNRRPFIQTMFQCYRNQTYPKNRMEWIIVDDGTDKIKDLVVQSNIPEIRYFDIENKMMLGAKRNLMHKHCRGSIIVYMDDDDYYPPERVSHAVERLQSNPEALCSGSSEIYIYFKHIHKMIQCGPYGKTHATAGTFAFRKELLDDTKYEDGAALAEEKAFLKDYTVPFVQLDPIKSILVFSHEHNTYDKRKMFDNAHPDFFKESVKTVDTFIKEDYEKDIKKFFLEDIDKLLENYDVGLPKMKPDVLKQIKIIEDKRAKMIQDMIEEEKKKPVMVNEPGKGTRQLDNNEIRQIINNQQKLITQLKNENQELQSKLVTLQSELISMSIQRDTVAKENEVLKQTKPIDTGSKLKPDIIVDVSGV
jgi:glycosyltransferase involved in cell wall biosynthesis